MYRILIGLVILFSLNVQARLLDKVVLIFNDQTISLSQVNRMQQNMVARQSISPQVYEDIEYSHEDLIQKVVERLLIRERLSEMGYIISDDQVESQIRSQERRLGISRSDLLQFLESNNTTFDEYFEIIRETIEFNVFNSNIIEPLINITEQEIRNAYYQANREHRTVAFNYHLISFSMPASEMTEKMLAEFPDVMASMQEGRPIPENFRNISTSDLGKISEDGMADAIFEVVQNTDENEFTEPVLLNDRYFVFFVRERDLIESSHFRQSRPAIYSQLYDQAFRRVTEVWFERQKNRHFIKINL